MKVFFFPPLHRAEEDGPGLGKSEFHLGVFIPKKLRNPDFHYSSPLYIRISEYINITGKGFIPQLTIRIPHFDLKAEVALADMLIFEEGDQKLYQKVFFPHFLIISQFLYASMITNLTVINNIAAITYSQCRSHILFSNEDGQTSFP